MSHVSGKSNGQWVPENEALALCFAHFHSLPLRKGELQLEFSQSVYFSNLGTRIQIHKIYVLTLTHIRGTVLKHQQAEVFKTQ